MYPFPSFAAVFNKYYVELRNQILNSVALTHFKGDEEDQLLNDLRQKTKIPSDFLTYELILKKSENIFSPLLQFYSKLEKF